MNYNPDKQIGVGWIDFQEEERGYIQDIMDSARLSYGPYSQKFEEEFAKIHGVEFAMFCNSGTAALQAGLNALKIKYNYRDGDEVIVPALTFVASVNVVLQNNLKPVFVDVDPYSFNIDPSKVKKKITPRTRSIMPVHVGGLACDMGRITPIAKDYGLQVIEDSCETMFAERNGKRVGSFGDIACFSTHIAHIIATGVGGLAITDDPELAILIKSLFNHGRDPIYLSMDDDKGKHGIELSSIIAKRFNFEYAGYSSRGTEFDAALGLAQLHRWKENVSARIANSHTLSAGLEDLAHHLQLPVAGDKPYEHVYMFYPLVVKNGDREKLVNYLEEHNIETRYLLPLLSQPVYKKLWGDIENDYPVAANLNKNAFYIACHQGLTEKDLDYIIKTFHDYYKNIKG